MAHHLWTTAQEEHLTILRCFSLATWPSIATIMAHVFRPYTLSENQLRQKWKDMRLRPSAGMNTRLRVLRDRSVDDDVVRAIVLDWGMVFEDVKLCREARDRDGNGTQARPRRTRGTSRLANPVTPPLRVTPLFPFDLPPFPREDAQNPFIGPEPVLSSSASSFSSPSSSSSAVAAATTTAASTTAPSRRDGFANVPPPLPSLTQVTSIAENRRVEEKEDEEFRRAVEEANAAMELLEESGR
ncbi:MAG: hypothetical protein M1817_004164 [Caeruleum heppii]|nr:MAG: hypothetical protein M1817_004164 [Caeruleum heppii]